MSYRKISRPDGRILVIDAGTSSMRAVLYDADGRVLDMSQNTYSPRFPGGGRAEQDPQIWIDGLYQLIADCPGSQSGLDALALTSARSSVIPVDSKGRALSDAIMWQDTRAEAIVREFDDSQADIHSRTGMKMNTVVSAPTIQWMRREEPELYKRSAKIVGIQDFLIKHLTGRFVTDESFGSRTLLMNIESRRWDDQLLAMFGIDPGKLCDLVPPGSLCGTLQPEAAAALGLKAGIPVVSSGGDQQCAAVGQGVTGPGLISINTGTGAYLIRGCDLPILDPGLGLVCNAAALDGQYILEASVPAAGSLYSWLQARFSEAGGTDVSPKQMDAMIDATPPGSNGVLVLPSFAGRGSPDWDSGASGAFLNLRLETTAGDMARSVLESLACELMENIQLMRSLTGRERTVHSSGGMSRFATYNQMLADALANDIIGGGSTESTSLGAWIVAAVTLGLFPNPAAACRRAREEAPQERTFHPGERGHRMFTALLQKRRVLSEALRQAELSIP